ncbi:hypothetical protein L227DRAFT_568540 [Lentinus tigrinus ALCF2SS1-6]|uniref:Uncharacterized protein n=1 Tax=Lentinus tigrinus ALCF2SS1-6 TaxID=1328759 RepID=A0A5C2RN11_9APHY|nr:hypothetical protein L227DRAFT_568540 [Lentinus tigrinus ALCF2SS1-6]
MLCEEIPKPNNAMRCMMRLCNSDCVVSCGHLDYVPCKPAWHVYHDPLPLSVGLRPVLMRSDNNSPATIMPEPLYTTPSKSEYTCALCNKTLALQTCLRANYVMFGCKYVECQHAGTRFTDWPKRFEWVTWRYFPDLPATCTNTRPQTPPLVGTPDPPSYHTSSRRVTPPSDHTSSPDGVEAVSLHRQDLPVRSSKERTRRGRRSKPYPSPRPRDAVIDLTLSPGSSFDNPIVL